MLLDDRRIRRGEELMRKSQKKEILDILNSLQKAHEEIRQALTGQNHMLAQNMLTQCQTAAVSLGETIERLEGEGHITVSFFEEYCELLFKIYEDINKGNINKNKDYKMLRKQLVKIENSIKNDIVVKKEIVFFPYKASMWDSLESIYFAVKADLDCNAYCVPIPYYDLCPDHSLGQMHYEGYNYPKNIEIIDWQKYDFENRKPDIIYIHNPYDDWNLVTSIHPRFYSANLKKYTDCLVYVPYYSTTGGMSEGQRTLPVYFNADYIVTQAPMFRDYFDERIPNKKFLPFGSPKFDRIINKCKNPPEPPAEWKKKMEGRKVYFYNTSIGGMLDNTENFLKKMQYVFSCFKDRRDVCLLWRPHPLLESTFDSIRPQYKKRYESLKSEFVSWNFGILDETSDIANAIALSDIYIGDGGTSVTSLFGLVGKPIFILNNHLHSEPKEDSWRGEIYLNINPFEQDQWLITQGNRLYKSEPFAYDYKYCFDLSNYIGPYYSIILEINGKKYACPGDAQHILVLGENGIEKRIELEKKTAKNGAFCTAYKYKKYLLLIPFNYPALVLYDTQTEKIIYLPEHIDIFIRKDEKGQTIIGGVWIYKDFLYIASPTDNYVYKLDIESEISQILEIPVEGWQGCAILMEYEGDFWLMPYKGKVVLRWNIDRNEIKEYTDFPEDYKCVNKLYGYECDELPFGTPAFYKNKVYLPPLFGNMYLKLNMDTGKITKWQPLFEEGAGEEYYYTTVNGFFLWHTPQQKKGNLKLYSYPNRKLYDINPETDACKEISVKFDLDELKANEHGFGEYSEWIGYICLENAFNSLTNFLDGKIRGKKFDRVTQIATYQKIAANNDGSCGEKVHKFIKDLV